MCLTGALSFVVHRPLYFCVLPFLEGNSISRFMVPDECRRTGERIFSYQSSPYEPLAKPVTGYISYLAPTNSSARTDVICDFINVFSLEFQPLNAVSESMN